MSGSAPPVHDALAWRSPSPLHGGPNPTTHPRDQELTTPFPSPSFAEGYPVPCDPNATARKGLITTPSRSNPASAGGPLFRKQIDICAINQAFLGNPKASHQYGRLRHARFRGFTIPQHDLQLQEIAQTLDAIQMNARPAYDRKTCRFLTASSRHPRMGNVYFQPMRRLRCWRPYSH